ncbi:ATP-binding cassette domain-containing protein [Legionella sp. W05-934-2]|uniref:ATP-binding cassette domain-containing protein n=1 Tax=Legionella sp. W05-934-2 TaxID=1198649 RepID=UPI0034630095
MAENQILVEINQICKTFPPSSLPALNAINLSIKRGEMLGLVGPDGAGKTTLIRLIIGLLLPSSGTITVLGFDSQKQAQSIHLHIGYMPQKFGLYEDLSVIENLTLYADLRGVVGEKRQKKFAQLLRFTSLDPFQSRLAGQLSGGMKQKLGLACALVGEPELLVLDEPSVGVDPISRRELWQMVQELIEGGMGVIWSTAYLDEAERCDRVLLLNEGNALYQGKPDTLLSTLKDRCWHVAGVASNIRRQVLLKLLNEKQCLDGVIQGENLRIVTRNANELPKLPDGLGAHWLKVAPVFEDAFMDKLGGGPGGESALAEAIPEKPASKEAVIEARNLTKRFGDFIAVSDNSFTIQRGEIFGLLGPNGAGKSTTFKMLCGLLQPTSGDASVMGFDLRHSTSQARSRLGYMAQKFSLYGQLNAFQNLQFFSGLYGLSGKKQKQSVDEMIQIFDLHKHLNQNAGDLPLGFKQRLALACALMHEPDILFLDEPTSGVDPVTRREFWLHINSLVNKGVTVMVTTHFMDEAEYCDRIALIYRGQNIATDTPDNLKKRVTNASLPHPTMEDAFIALIEGQNQEHE